METLNIVKALPSIIHIGKHFIIMLLIKNVLKYLTDR